jgi:hypothetical protein
MRNIVYRVREKIMIKRTFTRANRRTVNDPNSKPAQYRDLVFLGVGGVILLVLGFIIPGWGWLAWLGFILIWAAAFTFRLGFIGAWIPTLLAKKERDNKDFLPPPPTI